MTSDPQETELGWRATLRRIDTPNIIEGSENYEEIVVDVEMHLDYRLRIKVNTVHVHVHVALLNNSPLLENPCSSFQIYDADEQRFQVPAEAVNISRPEVQPDNRTRLFDVEFENEPQFGIRVIRRSTNTVV